MAKLYKGYAEKNSTDGFYSILAPLMIDYCDKVLEFLKDNEKTIENLEESVKWHSEKLEEIKNSKPIIYCKDCKYRDKTDSHRCTYDAPQELWQEREFNPGFVTNDCYCWHAETIVRCKDCVHKTKKNDSSGTPQDYCSYRKNFVNVENYCSWGERSWG